MSSKHIVKIIDSLNGYKKSLISLGNLLGTIDFLLKYIDLSELPLKDKDDINDCLLDLESIHTYFVEGNDKKHDSKYSLLINASIASLEKIFSKYLKYHGIMFDVVGKVAGEYKYIKIFADSKISGGYLLSLYKTLPQKDSDLDEWFDNYEELEKYFKDNNLQVEWLEE